MARLWIPSMVPPGNGFEVISSSSWFVSYSSKERRRISGLVSLVNDGRTGVERLRE
jgi:hypothetical protein